MLQLMLTHVYHLTSLLKNLLKAEFLLKAKHILQLHLENMYVYYKEICNG